MNKLRLKVGIVIVSLITMSQVYPSKRRSQLLKIEIKIERDKC